MKVLVIDRASMGMGGIESNYSNIMKYSVAQGYRVIWLTTHGHEQVSAFKEITDDPRVEKQYVLRSPFGPVYPKLNWSPDDEVTVLTTDLLRYFISNAVFSLTPCARYSHLLTVPHFKGFAIFPEKCFNAGLLRSYWQKKMAKGVGWLNQNNVLVGFSRIHLDAYENNYGIAISNKSDKLVPPVFSLEKPSKEEIASRSVLRKNRFNIVTCTRFDFPHKGYLLGLIKSFAKIHAEYPQTSLIIIGYGEGQNQVNEAIRSLPVDTRHCVELTGSLSQNELKKRMRRCHVNVGVAGSMLRGAECALPCIVMRHYTKSFEGYGLFEDVGKKMSDAPGADMSDVLCNLITCSDEEYITRSFASFEKVDSMSTANPEFVFTAGEVGSERPPIHALSARVLFFARLCFEKLAKRSPFEDRNNE